MSMRVRSLALLSGLRSSIAVSCGVGCRRGSHPALKWLWLEVAALIRPLAWEHPYAACVALKKQKKKERKEMTSYNSMVFKPLIQSLLLFLILYLYLLFYLYRIKVAVTSA